MKEPGSATKMNTLNSRIVCLLLALHFFNCSIDPQDPHPDFIAENLAINDIESVAELVIEGFFGLENVFKEHDETDHDHSRIVNIHKLYLVTVHSAFAISMAQGPIVKYFIKDSATYTGLPRQILTPPPRG